MNFKLILLCVLLVAGISSAQDPGDVIVGFSPNVPFGCDYVSGFVVDFLYVQGWELGDITGWEASLVWSDPTWNILGVTLNPETALNVGNVGNFIVGLGACVQSAQLHTLATYQFGYFVGPVAPNDVLICVGPATPSSFGSSPGGYSSCSDQLNPFGIWQNGLGYYPNGCGVVNSTYPYFPGCSGVGTEDRSWGGLKGRYR